MDGWDRIEVAWRMANTAWRRWGWLVLSAVVLGVLLGMVWALAR